MDEAVLLWGRQWHRQCRHCYWLRSQRRSSGSALKSVGLHHMLAMMLHVLRTHRAYLEEDAVGH